MYAAVLAALRSVLGWFLGQTVLKGVILTVLAVLVAFLGQWLFGLLPDYMSGQALSAMFTALPAGVWWLLDLFRVPQGFPVVLSASVVVFLIRRIPVVG